MSPKILQWKPICKYGKRCLKSATIYGPICEYYNGCLKNQLLDLYANITMDVKKINNYLKELYVSIAMDIKKPTTIYETYIWVLHI
jgi:hypothetical protein